MNRFIRRQSLKKSNYLPLMNGAHAFPAVDSFGKIF